MSLLASGRISHASPLPSTLFSNNLNPIKRVPSFELDAPPIRNVGNHNDGKQWQHLYVLPVLLLEFLALALTRAVLPRLLLERYGDRVYLVLGFADCIRGLLAFVVCPIFGRLSDIVGRRLCLLVTVAGTCAPVCVLALLWSEPSTKNQDAASMMQMKSEWNNVTTTTMTTVLEGEDGSATTTALPILWNQPSSNMTLSSNAINVFVVLLALSGVFASTFTLVFAYISDTVRQRDERVSAYGLALATFGLSFTIGPMAGGYLSQASTHYVFLCSLLLTLLDLLYIYFVLPESREFDDNVNFRAMSILTMDQHRLSWSPVETMRLIAIDPFLRKVGQVAFLYYTGLWAVISTLSLYAVKRFHMGPERLGELMSALGLCTMVAEAVLVRILVPLLGEKRSMRLGLAAFSIQCVVLGLAYEGWHLFVCAALSMLGNLVFPSLSSLVSGSVEPESVGEALGAVNGIKALTEGIGPLVFGSLMTISEGSAMPGWPYILAALLVWAAYNVADHLPDTEDDDYIHEMERKNVRGSGGIILQFLGRPATVATPQKEEITSLLDDSSSEEDEDGALLSEVDESEDERGTNKTEDLSRLPVTFASLMKQPPTSPLRNS